SAYREKHQNVALGKESTLASDKLRELNTRLTQVMAERTRAEAAAREIAALGPRPDMDAIMKLQGGAVGVEISQLKGTLAQKEAAFAMLQQRYLSQHPKYIAATNELRALRAKVADFSTNALTTLKANLAHLAATEKDLRAQVGR